MAEAKETLGIASEDAIAGDAFLQEPAMTPQQRQLARAASSAGSGLSAYKQIIVGDAGWGHFLAFEAYRFLFEGMSSLLGIGCRRLILPRFFGSCGKGLVTGTGVVIREPRRISLGRNVILDDYSSIDVRTREGQDKDAFLEIGDYSYIGRQSVVSAKYGQIRLGAGCNIGYASRIATREKIEIGKSVLIASYVYIGAGNHGASSLDVPVMEQEMERKGGVSIGDNSWIGTKATIVDGVRIGRDAIVGAHSLVREDVPDRAIVAGTPARIIRYRE